MCGIVGYVGQRPVQEILLAGPEKLEYRGYDSAGISIQSRRPARVRARRRQPERAARRGRRAPTSGGGVAVAAPPATTGIGHTRWATHGRVSEENAHPHFDAENRVHIVVNGIVENYMELKQELLAAGADFTSETDVEVMAHLIAARARRDGDLVEAVRRAYNRLRGHYAFVAVAADEPGVLVGARKECPLIVGRGDGEQFLASGIPAFLAHTRTSRYIENDEIVVVRPEGVEFITAAGEPVERRSSDIDWDAEEAEKGGYETFMLKEIHEQADAVAETIADRTVRPDGIDLPGARRRDAARVPADRDRRLRHLLPRGPDRPLRDRGVGARAGGDGHRVRVPLSQPDRRPRRPRDRHHAVGRDGRHAGRDAARPLARREGGGGHQHHGLAGHARRRRRAVHALRPRDLGRRHEDVHRPGRRHVPARAADGRAARDDAGRAPAPSWSPRSSGCRTTIAELLDAGSEAVDRVAERFKDADFFLYLGRHVGLPVCLEGALKLKEISYTATDAYAAGEMKHGPIALLDEGTPVVVVATDSPVLDKVISNMQEVRARGARGDRRRR